LSAAFQRCGVPGLVVENDVRSWTEPVDGVRQLAKYVLHVSAERVASGCSRRTSMVVAETQTLNSVLVNARMLPPDRVHVVDLGGDHPVFHPTNQAAARRPLGRREDAAVLLYVGAMDECHDLEPVIDALGRVTPPNVELHIVGGGEYRERYEARAQQAR